MVIERTRLLNPDQAIKLFRFTPRRALTILNGTEFPDFFRTWALARLLTWAILDQKSEKRSSPSKLRRRNARSAGHLTLAYLLDRRLQSGDGNAKDDILGQMLALFRASGGFSLFVKGSGARSLLSRAQKRRTRRELKYVYFIVLYMCRYKEFLGQDGKFNLETAKQFVIETKHEGKQTYGISKVSKTWEKYKSAAPYIFAFHRFLSELRPFKSPTEAVEFFENLASGRPRLDRILGRAAYAADILSSRVKSIRDGDFRNIARHKSRLRAFSVDEKLRIHRIDRNAPIA
jgi:hypothetical protein